MNIIQFPIQKNDAERVRLYRDEPCVIVVLPLLRIGHAANRGGHSAEQSRQS